MFPLLLPVPVSAPFCFPPLSYPADILCLRHLNPFSCWQVAISAEVCFAQKPIVLLHLLPSLQAIIVIVLLAAASNTSHGCNAIVLLLRPYNAISECRHRRLSEIACFRFSHGKLSDGFAFPTFSLSTRPWKKRKSAASAKSGLEASINLWAASAPDLRLDPSRPKNGRTMVWNHSKARLQKRREFA